MGAGALGVVVLRAEDFWAGLGIGALGVAVLGAEDFWASLGARLLCSGLDLFFLWIRGATSTSSSSELGEEPGLG